MSASHKKRILIIASEFPPNVGGIGNHAYNIAKYLSKENYIVEVVADVIRVKEHELAKLKKEITFKFHPVKRSKSAKPTYIKRVLNAISYAFKADIIICSGKFSLWLIKPLKKLYKHKKTIAIVHGTELQLPKIKPRQYTEECLLTSDAIIAVSHFTKNLLQEPIKKNNNVFVIPNGIDIKEFEPSEKTKTITANETIRLITVGSQSERKGQENVMKAIPLLLKYFPNIEYHLVGKSMIQDHLEEVAKELGVIDKIHFHGVVARNELIEILQKAHVKLMLSNRTTSGDVEGFGIAVLEANALSIPAIGAKDCGLADAIDNYKTGILVDPKNAESIVNALKEIISDYSFYSANAIAWAKEHDWNILIKKYVEVIESIC